MGQEESAANRLSNFYSKMTAQTAEFRPAQTYFFDAEMLFGINTPTNMSSNVVRSYVSSFKYLLVDVDIPNFDLHGKTSGIEIITPVGKWVSPANSAITSHDELSLKFIDTDASIIENFFYPWMIENSLTQNSQTYKPFVRATFIIWPLMQDGKTKRFRYEIEGAYPVRLQTPTLSQAANNTIATRSVSFDYNKVNVYAEYDNSELDSFDDLKKHPMKDYKRVEADDQALKTAADTRRLERKVSFVRETRVYTQTTSEGDLQARLEEKQETLLKNTPAQSANKGSSGNRSVNIEVKPGKKPIVNMGEANILKVFGSTTRADEIIPAPAKQLGTVGNTFSNK